MKHSSEKKDLLFLELNAQEIFFFKASCYFFPPSVIWTRQTAN